MTDIHSRRPIRRALLSVYDKTGLDAVVAALASSGAQIVSTGGTAELVASLGVAVTMVERLTDFPECLDGRVKTLHPVVHAGLLADLRRASHRDQLAALGIEPFDLLVSNLYPFSQTVANGADLESCLDQIDIGGPAMVRAAAKNHANVAVVTSPASYPLLLEALQNGGLNLIQRRLLAARAFADIAAYDVAVANWCARELSGAVDGWPEFTGSTLRRQHVLRYGENPHQQAALYAGDAATPGLAQASQLAGKEMSFNNYVDAEAAWRACHDFADPAVVIVKHATPCGLATGADIAEAYRRALAGDPTSAFGGVVAANRPVSVELAELVTQIVTDVIVAPSYDDGATRMLTARKNLRVLVAPPWQPSIIELRRIGGGALTQTADMFQAPGDDTKAWRLVCGNAASQSTLRDLEFAWRAVRSVKSNAILLASDCASVGIGMGQVNRVDAAKLAVSRAGDRARGAVAASDAFFPFVDGLSVLAQAGVAALVQPGGSVRDPEVIAAAAEAGLTMYLTGARHFLH